VICCVLAALGVYASTHVDWAPPAGVSEQLPPPANVPLPSEERVTFPLGGLALPVSLSATVTEQLVGTATESEAGSQSTVVSVERSDTLRAVAPLLVASVALPA
jgi:hypothetical protein